MNLIRFITIISILFAHSNTYSAAAKTMMLSQESDRVSSPRAGNYVSAKPALEIFNNGQRLEVVIDGKSIGSFHYEFMDSMPCSCIPKVEQYIMITKWAVGPHHKKRLIAFGKGYLKKRYNIKKITDEKGNIL